MAAASDPVPTYEAPNPVAAAVWRACIDELEAPKPGNVSFLSDGHGMTAEDFVASARCAADVLGTPGLSLGERVLGSVEATHAATGCNTNLGIVLLCAPLAHAALDGTSDLPLRARLARVLEQASIEDTARVFEAIRIAEPAGLGESVRHDVRAPAAAPLLAVMREAAARDRVARQYALCFEDIFGFGLTEHAACRTKWPGIQAVAALYLAFLARFMDTHIERRLGSVAAEGVRLEALRLLGRLEASRSSDLDLELLMSFDSSLKRRRINPGTSADLTVATLLAGSLLDEKGERVPTRSERGATEMTTTRRR